MLTKVFTAKHFLVLVLLTISLTQATSNWLTCYSQPNGAVLPVNEDCHVYIYCLDQTPFTIACPFGMGFSASQGHCVALGKSDCVTDTVTPTSTSGRVQSKGTCDNEKREANKQACKGQPFGELVPYPGDCSKFLVCNCEYPTVKQCQGGTWFDNTIKTCNYPQNVNCKDGNGSGETTTTGITSTSTSTTTLAPSTTNVPESTPEWGQSCEAPAGMSEDICLKYNNGVLLRYPYNCNAYINCTMGCPVMNYCPPDKVFNAFLKICDTPDTAQCIELPLPPSTTPSTSSTSEGSSSVLTTTEESTIPSTTTEKPSSSSTTTEESSTPSTEISTTTESSSEWGKDCETPPGMSADICLKYNNGLLLRYPYDCNAYINCTMGCPVMDYCPPDKVFNELLKICDTPDTAHCIELPMPPSTTTEETTSSTTTPTTTTEESTTSSTTQETSTTTTTEITTTTTEQPDICIPPLAVEDDICSSANQIVFQPYPYNCTAYILCKGLEPCLKYCEPGKIFNTLLGICDDDIECEEVPLPTTTTKEPIITTTEISTTTTPQPLPPNVNPNICQGKEDYTTYPYESDCSQYLLCLDGEVKLENCPEGWLFNSKLMLCDKASEDVCYTGPATTTTPQYTTSAIESTTKDAGLELCEGQALGKTFPYKDNCQFYYYCKGNGEYFIISCPRNSYYDPYSGDCGPNVSPTACQQPLTTTVAPTTPATTLNPAEKCSNQPGGVTYPYVEDCSKYIYCMGNGGYIIMNCPYNNYYYPDTGDCGPSDDVNICRIPVTTTSTTPITTTEVIITTPTPVKGICGNYSNGQLIPYPDNCQKYISCVKPIAIGFYCYNNWYFDDVQQKCVPDEQGVCTGSELPGNETTTVPTPSDICQGLKEGDWQIYPTNCQFYYECLGDGYYMLKICDQGEYFDPLVGQCSAEVDSDYCKQNFNTTLPPPTTPTPKPKPQGICAGKESGDIIAYPKNCSKYIVCEIPIPVGYNCAAGLEFSTEAQKCVEPYASDCGLLTTTTTTTLEPTTKPYNQCTNKPDFTLLPYKQDCAMFIICLKDMEHWAYCPLGEYFDLNQMQCTKQGNEESCLAAALTTTTEATTTTTQDPNLGPCYNKPDGTKIPYPNNCTKYIVCEDPLNVGYDCPEGLEFSIHYDECVEPELADCSIKTTSSTTTTTVKTTTPLTPQTCENQPTGTTLPYTEDCSKYYICINGKEILANCMPNSYYDPETGDCDPDISPMACQGSVISTTPKPTIPQGPCMDKDNGYIYTNEENCSQYYMCLNDTSILCQCQNQTYYNPYTKECDKETSQNYCKEPLTSSSLKPTTTTEVANTNSTTEESTASTENGSSSSSTIEPTTSTESTDSTTGTTVEPTNPPQYSQDNICCGRKSGTYLPYPGDSSKYVICQYPVPEVHSCVEGGTYDPESYECKLVTPFSISKPDCTQSRYGETMVYKGDCTKYYFCYGSEAVILDCSFNWNYDPSIEQCVPKNQYKCPW